MMSVKLTLSIPRKVLIGAKAYSKRTGQPLSRLVSRYFSALSILRQKKSASISPSVEKITGLAQSGSDDKTLLWEGLSRKYKL